MKNSQNNADIGISNPAEVSMVDLVDSSTMLKVPTSGVRYTATIPTNINALPKMVKIRNFMAEYSFRPLPHTEINIYIGTSSTSQKRKNRSRSIDVKTPNTAVWSTNSQMKYSLTLNPTCQDAKTAHTPRRPVKATKGALNPSTASRNSALSPTSGIQVILSTN